MSKTSYLLLMLLFPVFLMAGCSKDDDNDVDNGKQIVLPDETEKEQTAFADEKTSGNFTFTAKSAWSATVTENLLSRASSVLWLRLLLNGTETYKGEAGTFTLTIEIDPNFTGKKRSATITVISGTENISVTVTQEGTTKEGELPEPDPSADYSEFIVAALNKTAKSDVLTVRATQTYTSGWPHNENKTINSWLAYDRTGSRKCIEYQKTTDNKTSSVTTNHVKYLEDNQVYYLQSGNITGAKKYICGIDPDSFWDKFNSEGLLGYLKTYCELPPREWNKYVWTVNGNEYTAKYTSASGSISEEIKFLTNGNSITSIQFNSFDVTDVVNEIEKSKEITFEYTASPSLPEGFSKEDFEPAQQYTLRVVWGDEGESIFYTDYRPTNSGYIGSYGSDGGIAPETILLYTPQQSGKTAEYYFDRNFTQPVEMAKPIYITDNNTVIYVKWINK